ncbi:MAG TPA: VapC toxin family PIN domain ribonuclease [Phycisphaerales bacterium]|nr:VapC toxin family PIN domain ribonuclease [Phycisphaerales bacterium]
MIVLDTNVLSALMRVEPDRAVVRWLNGLAPESIWTTSITLFELQFGIDVLPDGERKTALQNAFHQAVYEDMQGRILDFDAPAAAAAGTIAARQRALGRPVDMRDAQIAGIIAARRATLATRNVRHFADTGLALVDPWGAAG